MLSGFGATSDATYRHVVSAQRDSEQAGKGGRADLVLGEVLAVVGAGRRADVVQPALELGDVALRERDAELERLVGQRRGAERETRGRAGAALVHEHAPRGGLAERRGEQGGEEQAGGEHCSTRGSEEVQEGWSLRHWYSCWVGFKIGRAHV